MRSPERARRLFDAALDDASSPTPQLSSGSNISSYGSVHSYSSSSSGQKRSRRSSGLSSSPEAIVTARRVSATEEHNCDRPSSPRVNKALFTDAMSSDDDDKVNQSDDDGEQMSRRDSVYSNASSDGNTKESKGNRPAYRHKALRSDRSSVATKDATPPRRPQRALRRRPRSPLAISEPTGTNDHPMTSKTPTKGRRRSPVAPTNAAAIAPGFCSPALQFAASRQLRAVPSRHPLISPFVKGAEPDSLATQGPRSKAISSVPTSPLHSPTTVKLSKDMNANLSMKSPVQQVPRTPQKSSSVTPCKLHAKSLTLTHWQPMLLVSAYVLAVNSSSEDPRTSRSTGKAHHS